MGDVTLPGGLQLPEIASANLVAFVLVLGRIGPLFVLAPVLSTNMLPARAKFAAAAAMTLALAPIAAHGHTMPTDSVALALVFVQEVGVGVAFALALSVLVGGVAFGASLVDTLVGFSFGSLINPITGVPASVLGQLYTLLALMVFVLSGGVRLMIMGLARSYALVPLGTFPTPAALGRLATAAATELPLIGLELVGPVILAVVVVDAAFGLVARAVPQMNVFVIGLPVKVIVSFAVVAASLPFVATHLESDLQQAIGRALMQLGS
ncbi:MAG TPA: flagellar biosynthetic protein FliR [Gaiellales bacterium]